MRDKLVLEFWDRSNQLNIKNKQYRSFVEDLINKQLKEDIGKGDITTDSLIDNKKIKVKITAKQDGIIAGIEELSLIDGFKIKKYKKEGDKVKNNDIILEIEGNAKKILSYERTLLNIMQRMSGIATLTYNLNKKIGNNCFIAGTRKTILGLLDKKAVSVGHGLTHRLNLNDFILIKDNHLKILNHNIEKALKLANKNKTKYIEIEVKNEKEALRAAKTISNFKFNKMFAILFDNMKCSMIKNTINKINNLINKKTINNIKNKNYNNKKLKNKILFEASGNINEKNIKEYSKTGVDVISLGMLTHSVKAFDLSLEIK
jgi:nicotinate-nucleotide pyrophosphorylase (carboxylating)